MVATLKYFANRALYRVEVYILHGQRIERAFGKCFVDVVARPECHKGVALYFHDRQNPAFHFASKDISRIVNAIPERLKQDTIAEARAACERRFDFRHMGEWTFRDGIKWSYKHNDSISWFWDLNRHAYFLSLAKAYYYTKDSRYLDDLLYLWDNWIRNNPVAESVTWTHPFEVAARLQNWMWAFFLVVYADKISDSVARKFLLAMYEHATYIYSNLEYHWPNNHLLLEAKALLEFSVLFPEFDPKRKFLQRSSDVFRKQVNIQVLSDGCHSELCSLYHRIVHGELYEILLLGKKNSIPLPNDYEDKIGKMEQFSRALMRRDGSMPLLSDSADDDNYIRFDPVSLEKIDLNYWILPCRPDVQPIETAKADEPTLRIFNEGGYAFISDEYSKQEIHITFDFGEFSKNPAPDHSHCDCLSFELYGAGRPLIVDPGVYYSTRAAFRWRQYFRGTSAHNTVMVDNHEQSQLWRLSDVKSTARCRLVEHRSNNGCATVKAECYPYWSGKSGIKHIRTLAYRSNGRVTVADHIAGEGRHSIKWFFHFGPGITVVSESARRLSCYDENGLKVLSLWVDGRGLPTSSLVKGRSEPPMGWVSRTSCQLLATYSATFETEVELPFSCQFGFQVVPQT